MSQNHPACCSCNTPSSSVKHSRRNNLDLCDVCRSWVIMSLRRTHHVPAWIRPDPNMSSHELVDLREQFRESLQTDHRQARVYIQAHTHPIGMGFAYSGPLRVRGTLPAGRSWRYSLAKAAIDEETGCTFLTWGLRFGNATSPDHNGVPMVGVRR